jgi:glycosyltransferase involved in cell wall biosynthesis
MRICYFGIYDREYARNKVLIDGLKLNGAELLECNDKSPGIAKYLKLYLKHRAAGSYDVMFVAYPGQFVLPFAKLITGKPIIFDAFLSQYDSSVSDRRLTKPFSLSALKYFFSDWLSCFLADKILLDTDEHIKFFVDRFKIKKQKFLKIFVGADESVFYKQPTPKSTKYFVAHFHGSFIPLQGVDYIIKAAKLLEEKDDSIKFNLLGAGQTLSEMKALAEELEVKNVNFIGWKSKDNVANYLRSGDICLGIFGNTSKAMRVIPNKVYEGLACGKPVLTAETSAVKELLTDRHNVLFCKPASPGDLAKKILELKHDPVLAAKISKNGHDLFVNRLNSKTLGKELYDEIRKQINK